jgi:nucleoside 2-deoxyribosyltransferase
MADQCRHVFLSYSASNQELADLVIPVIRSAGFEVRTTRERGTTGKEIGEAVREEISSSDLVIMLVTPSAVSSPWLAFETGMARAFDIPVVVLYEGLRSEELPPYLSEFRAKGVSQVADVLRGVSEELALAE